MMLVSLTVTRRVSLVEQEVLTLPEYVSSTAMFSGVHVARSLVFCVMFCWSLFVFFLFFSFENWIVCPSSIYGFWFPVWYPHPFIDLRVRVLLKTEIWFRSVFIKPWHTLCCINFDLFIKIILCNYMLYYVDLWMTFCQAGSKSVYQGQNYQDNLITPENVIKTNFYLSFIYYVDDIYIDFLLSQIHCNSPFIFLSMS